MIKSMYENIKSRLKCNNELSAEFSCCLCVRQCEYLSPFYLQYLLIILKIFSVYTELKG